MSDIVALDRIPDPVKIIAVQGVQPDLQQLGKVNPIAQEFKFDDRVQRVDLYSPLVQQGAQPRHLVDVKGEEMRLEGVSVKGGSGNLSVPPPTTISGSNGVSSHLMLSSQFIGG